MTDFPGTAGDDAPAATNGADKLIGSTGNDTFNAKGGIDEAVYGNNFGQVDLTAEVKFVNNPSNPLSAKGIVEKYGINGDLVGTDTLTNIERITSGTGSLQDTIHAPLLDQPDGSSIGANVNLSTGSITLMGQYNNAPLPPILAGFDLKIGGFENVTTTNFADQVTGNSAANTISTFDGNDIIDGLDGNDIIDGGAGDDQIYGGEGDDTLTAGAGEDELFGGEGNDTLSGGDAGTTAFDGGEGEDTLTYATATAAVTVNVALGSVSAKDTSFADTFINVEKIVGSDQDDTFILSGAAIKLDGGAGNDTFVGSTDSANTVEGGAGTDTLSYAGSSTSVNLGVASIGDGTVRFMAIKGSQPSTTDYATGVESFMGSAGSDDTIDGSSLNAINTPGGVSAGASLDVDVGAGTFGLRFVSNEFVDSNYKISGFETIRGSQNADTVTGGSSTANLVLVGNDGNDTLSGGLGSDTVFGGEGNDTLAGGIGINVLDGGEGVDTATYAAATTAVTVNLRINTVSGINTADTLVDIEKVVGSAQGDTFKLADGTILVDGGAGDDSFIGSAAGSSTVEGGIGNDTLDYTNFGSPVILSSNGIANGAFQIAVEKSGDTVTTDLATGVETVIGTAGRDTLDGTSLDDRDLAPHVPLNASLHVDLGTGVARVQFGSSPENGVTFNAIDFEIVEGTELDDTITGGISTADLTLNGNDGDDTITGGEGDDTITGGRGANALDGGLGFDTVSYADRTSAVTVDLVNGSADTRYYSATPEFADTLTSIEKVIGTDSNDFFIMGKDAVEIDGGEGVDTVVYNSFDGAEGGPQGLTISLDPNADSDGIAAGHVLTNIENVVATAGDDWVIGDVTPGGDWGVENIFIGGAGDDILDGGMGDDVLQGGVGNDILLGGEGEDTASFLDAQGSVEVRLDLDYAEVKQGGEAVERDDLLSIENVVGSDYNDLIIGDAEDNSLYGGEGNDTLEGGAGEDYLIGGAGVDTASYIHSTRGVTAALTSVRPTLMGVGIATIDLSPNTGDAAGDTYSSIENLEGTNFVDALYGNEKQNVLQGRAGNDALYGNGGDDVLEGGTGADALNGGAGNDTASYENAASAVQASLVARKNALGGGVNDESRADTYVSIENLRGSAHDDRLVGSDGNNVLEGLVGNDTLDGGAGNDTLNGGAGNDAMNGGANNDVLLGGEGNDTLNGDDNDDLLIGGLGQDLINGGRGVDTVSYVDSTIGLTVDLKLGYGGAGSNRDTLTDIENATGSAYNDVLIGNDGDNVLSGGDGNDQLSSLAGNDTFDGGEGFDGVSYAGATSGITIDLASPNLNGGAAVGDTLISIESITGTSLSDVISGDASNNRIVGGAGNDVLDGRGGTNVLDGGAGNDLLKGGLGQNQFIGGTGTDTVDYSAATVGITIDLASGYAGGAVQNAQSDVLSEIENATGTSGEDVIRGTAGANILRGEGGNDVIQGNSGNDTLDGGKGDNTLDGGIGTDAVSYASAGLNQLYYTTATGTAVRYSTALGLEGTDTLIAIETLTATTGLADVIDASGETTQAVTVDLTAGTLAIGSSTMTVRSFENVNGGAGDDVISGNGAANTVNGGSGNDQLSGLAGDDILDGQDGDDILLGGTRNDDLSGGAGNDRLDGGTGSDTLRGGDGNDRLIGGSGNNTLDGGNGVDVVDYSAEQVGRVIDLSVKSAVSSAGTDQLAFIEGVIGSGASDQITGDELANFISGGGGADTITGGLGADVLFGNAGADIFVLNVINGVSDFVAGEAIDGGNDLDVIRFDTHGAAATLTLTEAVVSIQEVWISNAIGVTTGTSASNIDARGLAADQAVTLVGNDGNNVLTGNNDAANTLSGGGGNDTLVGGDLADTLVGGLGADMMDGGAGSDWADYSSSLQYISVNLQDLVQGTGGAMGDTLINIENVTGTALDDFIRGNSVSNHLVGSAGSDQLVGEAGDDILDGGAGADTLIGGDGIDLATYSLAKAGVTVDLTGVVAGKGDGLGDSFLQVENVEGSAFADTIYGNAFANVLTGGKGADKLFGGAGADRLVGGTGADVLTGGADADTFVFSKGDGADQIADFTAGQGDQVSLLGFGAALDSYAELSALFQTSGSNVIVNTGNGDTLTFTNVAVGSLTQDHFIFG